MITGGQRIGGYTILGLPSGGARILSFLLAYVYKCRQKTFKILHSNRILLALASTAKCLLFLMFPSSVGCCFPGKL